MAAGLATLRTLQNEDGWRRLEALGAYLEQPLDAVLARAPVTAKLVPARLAVLDRVAADARAALGRSDRSARGRASTRRVFHALLDQGIALAPSAFEIAFLSLAHTRRDVERLADGLAAALARRRART